MIAAAAATDPSQVRRGRRHRWERSPTSRCRQAFRTHHCSIRGRRTSLSRWKGKTVVLADFLLLTGTASHHRNMETGRGRLPVGAT
jgi:hypothetical protein